MGPLHQQKIYAQAEEPADLPWLDWSQEGGYYDGPFELELSTIEADIYFTTNGDIPNPNNASHQYRGPILIDRTTIVRAVAASPRGNSNILSHTYFIQEPDTRLMTVSLGIPPGLLFDPEKGLFVKGPQAVDSLWQKPGANFWNKGEFYINTEIFEGDGRCVFRSGTGFRLFGGMSRLFPQKSMTLVARKRYGESRFRYRFFGKDGLDKYKFLVLRNAGSDFGKAHFRDLLMTRLVDDWDLEKQDGRPAHVYLNGEYWGIYNIREKVNRYFIEGHQPFDKDSVDLMEHKQSLKRGSRRHYQRLINYLERYDLSDPVHMEWVRTQMEVENYLDHQIAQIYFDNQDAGGNIRYWRPQTPDGRWRWILYDTDWGFGLHEADAYKHNSLAFHTDSLGPAWPNPPWSTFLLRKLLENKGVRHDFINRMCDYLNTSLSSYEVQAKINDLYNVYSPEMDRHIERWFLSKKEWEAQIAILRTFADRRPDILRLHLMDRFDVGKVRQLRIEVSEGGQVELNNHLELDHKEAFNGMYFEKVPIHLVAIPDLGYRFSHWEGLDVLDGERMISLQLTENYYKIKAVFVPHENPLQGKVVINEICANNDGTGDWIELYNYSDQEVSLEGWMLTDGKNTYALQGANLPAREYIILAENARRFKKYHPNVLRVEGDFGFGLNKRGEELTLYTSDGSLVDRTTYHLPPIDTVFTLNLLLPYLDNEDQDNWEVLTGMGSPNQANDYYLASNIQSKRELWMEVGAAVAVIIICISLLFLRQRHVI